MQTVEHRANSYRRALRRTVALLLAATVVIVLAACSRSESEQPQPTSGDNSTRVSTLRSTSTSDHALTTGESDTQGGDGLIAFAANGDIYVVEPSGGGLRQVTQGPDDDFSPSWFPDGGHVAFRRAPAGGSPGKTAIYEAAIDGSGVRKARLPQDAEDLTWSPDASKIAYSGGLPGEYSKGDILVVDAAGSNPRRVAGWDDSTDEFLSWSPDGSEIVFASNHGLPSDEVRSLWITSVADGATRALTRVERTTYYSTDVHPSWSPDGKTIVFQSNRGTGDSHGAAIWLIDSDGGNLRRLPGAAGEFPSWSPDGTRIAFGRTRGIAIVGLQGGNPTTIATGLGYTPFANWSTYPPPP